MELKIVESPNHEIPEALGISKAREKELDIVIKAALEQQKGKSTDDFKNIVEACNNTEEVAYCVYFMYVSHAFRTS